MCAGAWRRRGEIRGGYFVEGCSGEQFARPEAIALLRKQKNATQELPPRRHLRH